jgi:hypothetical protein
LERIMDEPREEDLEDKPPVPGVQEDTEVPGEEPVPEEDFMNPEDADADETIDNKEEE